MSVSIKIDHKSRANLANIHVAPMGIARGLRNGLYEMGRENVKHTRNLIKDKRKTGRIYMIKGKPHQASAPGEAPATLSGELVRSVDYKVKGHTEMEFGDGVFYGKFLEDGTSKMEARPHLKTTVDDRSGENVTILSENVDKEIKRWGKM